MRLLEILENWSKMPRTFSSSSQSLAGDGGGILRQENMFLSAIWRNDKSKIETLFKLQFNATQVTDVNVDALLLFVVPVDTGKESARLEKAIVRDGSCQWNNAVFETVKFSKEPKTGKIKEKLYNFVVSTGISKPCIVGIASINFADYANAAKASTVSLPLKYSKSNAVLHVTIQKQQVTANLSDVEEQENTNVETQDGSLTSYLSNGDVNGKIKDNSSQDGHLKETTQIAGFNFNRRASNLSCTTTVSSESSSGLETPRELGISYLSNSPMSQKPNGSTRIDEERPRPQWDWSEASDHGTGTDDSTKGSRETIPRQRSHQISDDDIDKLKAEVIALSRKADLSELELQTLRKQIIKESKRGQEFTKEIANLKHERSALLAECEKLRGLNNFRYESEDPQAFIEEIRKELNYEKELNSDLRLQLQKTQDSNSKLLLAIQELDGIVEQKNGEMSNFSRKSGLCETVEDIIDTLSRSESDELDEFVKERRDENETYPLDRQIENLQNEIEIYRRDKEELEMQMEQLALDYEILKQENHEITYKLEQSQLQEQLKMQYECSSSYVSINELESLENELEKRSKDFDVSLATIKDLEMRIENLEEELEKQARGFEADIGILTRTRVEQEQRAIEAEKALRITRQKNVRTAEKLQEDIKRLSEQMGSTFEANEQVAQKALDEAGELHLQNSQLHNTIKQNYEKLQLVKDEYEAKLRELSKELLDKSMQLEQNKRHVEKIRVTRTQENRKLKAEIGQLKIDNNLFAKKVEQNENLEYEFDQTEINSLVIAIVLLKKDSDKVVDKLNKINRLNDEKERVIGLLQSELATVKTQSKDLKNLLIKEESEKEKLGKQVIQLKNDLKKKEDALAITEKKLKDGNGRSGTKSIVRNNKSVPVSPSSKEITNLKEKIKSLQGQIKSKEAAFETCTNTYLEKEKELKNKTEELERKLEVLSQSNASLSADQFQKEEAGRIANDLHLDELKSSLAQVKERNEEMGNELKEMQERYSEISLKFAEVEVTTSPPDHYLHKIQILNPSLLLLHILLQLLILFRLVEKLRRLKKKYRTVVSKLSSGKDFSFKSPHDQATYEISRKIWTDIGAVGRSGGGGGGGSNVVAADDNGLDDDDNGNHHFATNMNLCNIEVKTEDFEKKSFMTTPSASKARPRKRARSKLEEDMEEEKRGVDLDFVEIMVWW
ncbi:hypothetical protein ACFE04_005468 [Oxalis oulophora]